MSLRDPWYSQFGGVGRNAIPNNSQPGLPRAYGDPPTTRSERLPQIPPRLREAPARKLCPGCHRWIPNGVPRCPLCGDTAAKHAERLVARIEWLAVDCLKATMAAHRILKGAR